MSKIFGSIFFAFIFLITVQLRASPMTCASQFDDSRSRLFSIFDFFGPRKPKIKLDVDYVKAISADLQDFWKAELANVGVVYSPFEVVISSGSVRSGCGVAGAAEGPFYCPADATVYIDIGVLDYFNRMDPRLGPEILVFIFAHEVGHHVQNVSGLYQDFYNLKISPIPGLMPRLKRMTELHADALAGYFVVRMLQGGALGPEDLKSFENVLSVIGDDHIHRVATGTLGDTSQYEHGTVEERIIATKVGMEAPDFKEILVDLIKRLFPREADILSKTLAAERPIIQF